VTSVLYRWPKQAGFGRVVPKTKFYEHALASASIKQRFVAEVQRITWAYKLAEETLTLRGTSAVPEIQVFVVEAKGDDVSNEVLSAIDKAVPTSIIFEVVAPGGAVRMCAAYKSANSAKPKPGAYFGTEWVAAEVERAPLPSSLDLGGLYHQLVSALLPIPAEPGEAMEQATARVEQAKKIEHEIQRLERRLRTEPQLNRKMDLRRQVQQRSADLAELTRSNKPSSSEDAPWTS
jgi:hypothetical protein